MEIGGTYPMLYAFFDESEALRRNAFSAQVSAAIASGASGIAALGLGTEAGKLSGAEKRAIVEWVIADSAGRLPVSVTVSGGNVPDMIAFAQDALAAGAAWIVLQPPRPPISGNQLIRFFGRIADALDCPVAIQNAPEFLGSGLSAEELVCLHKDHANVQIVKAESSALAAGALVEKFKGRMGVFNGRAGLELTDNFRAGVTGMIPGLEMVDHQVGVERAMREGRETQAEERFRLCLPAISFIMQGLPHFLAYGKHIAALRLGIAPSGNRLPFVKISEMGARWARRYADQLGPLPH